MIEFNYQSAISQANELDQVSQSLDDLVNLLKRQTSELQAAWKGEAADLYMKKINDLMGDLKKTAKTAGGIASSVNVAAKAIKAAEEAAKKIAETAVL